MLGRRESQALPDEFSIDVFLEQVYFWQKIDEGERQVADGASLTQEEVEQRLGQWLK